MQFSDSIIWPILTFFVTVWSYSGIPSAAFLVIMYRNGWFLVDPRKNQDRCMSTTEVLLTGISAVMLGPIFMITLVKIMQHDRRKRQQPATTTVTTK